MMSPPADTVDRLVDDLDDLDAMIGSYLHGGHATRCTVRIGALVERVVYPSDPVAYRHARLSMRRDVDAWAHRRGGDSDD